MLMSATPNKFIYFSGRTFGEKLGLYREKFLGGIFVRPGRFVFSPIRFAPVKNAFIFGFSRFWGEM